MFIYNTFWTYSNSNDAFLIQTLQVKFKCRENNQYINPMESIQWCCLNINNTICAHSNSQKVR